MSHTASRASREAVSAASQAALMPTVSDAQAIFSAVRAIESEGQLLKALTDSSATADARANLAERIFAKLPLPARSVVVSAVRASWSEPADLLDALQLVGVQLAARADSPHVVGEEIRQFADIVAANPELELTLGNRLASGDDKAAIVQRLLGGKAKESTVAILEQVVRSPRGRKLRRQLQGVELAVAEAAGESLATVTTATPLTPALRERIGALLQRRYGRTMQMAEVLDPSILGGIRIDVGDDVIDGTIRSKYNDLRRQLV